MFTKLKQLGMACLCALGIVALALTVPNAGIKADAATVTASGTFNSGGTWSLDSDGVLTLKGDIACDTASLDYDSWPWYSNASKIKSVVSDDVTLTGTDYSWMFRGCTSLTDLSGLASWNTSNVTDMYEMFYNCTSLTDLSGLASWNTSNVTDMSRMFSCCSSLKSLDLSGWDTSSVTNMRYMFWNCESLTNLDLSGWNTSNVTDMRWMFSDCGKLTDLSGLANWDTSNVTDMRWMFYNCTSLTNLDLSGWNTSNVTDMSRMFYNCKSLTDFKIADTATISINEKAQSVTIGGTWNLDKSLKIYNAWIDYCSSVVSRVYSVEIQDGTKIISNASNVFKPWHNVTDLDLSNLDISEATSFYGMFSGMWSLKSGKFPGGGEWSLNDGILTLSGDIQWLANDSYSWPWSANRDSIKKVVIKSGTKFSNSAAYVFANCVNLSEVEGLDNLDASKTGSAKSMFENCYSLGDLSGAKGWHISNIKDMSSMFANCITASKKISSDDLIANWTIAGDADIADMFKGWDISNNDRIESFEVALSNASSFTYKEDSGRYYTTSSTSPTYSINISLSGKDSEFYPVGSVQIRIPASLVTDRFGNRNRSSISWSIPQAPSTSSSNPFNYYYDEENSEYVIANTEQLSAASQMSFVLPYNAVAEKNDTKTDDFYAKLSINTDTTNISEIKTAPGIYRNVSARYSAHYFQPVYSSDVSADDEYVYVYYIVYRGKSGAEPSTEEVVATSNLGECISGIYKGQVTNSSFEIAYPIKELNLQDGQSHRLDVTVNGELYGYDGSRDSFTISTSYTYQYSQFNPSGSNSFSKSGLYDYGSLDVLKVEEPANISYSISFGTTVYDDTKKKETVNTGKKRTITIADKDVTLADGTVLTPEDYEIDSVSLSTSTYEYYETSTGWFKKSSSSNYTARLYKKNADGTWAKVDKISDIAGSDGFKLEIDTENYSLSGTVRVRLKIKPSKTILEKIKGVTELKIVNTAHGDVTCADGENLLDEDSSANYYLKGLSHSVEMYKNSSSFSPDNINQRFSATYRVGLYDRYSSASDNVLKKLNDSGIIKLQNSGTFYDLLPAGMTVDTASVCVGNYISSSYSVTDRSSAKRTVKTIENFNNTGRTLLIISVEWTDGAVHDGFAVSYTVYYPYESIVDFGNTLTNNAIYKTGNDSWEYGSDATKWVTDLSSIDGDTDKALYKSAYCTNTVSIGSAVELSLTKSVKDSDASDYSQGHKGEAVVSDSESYSYKLRFGSTAGTKTSNIILFDSLENYTLDDGTKSGWKGIFDNIDLSQPKLKGIDPVVYYSTIEELDLDVNENHDITNTDVWSATAPDDLSSVTAIAVDMRKTTTGEDYVLPEKSTIRVTVNMKAPTGDDYIIPARAGLKTYNNVYLSDTLTTTMGYAEDQYIHYDYTEVSLLKPATASMSAEKKIDDTQSIGRSITAGEFSFNLMDEDGNVLQTKPNDENGKIVFDSIEYKDKGEYKYKIAEVIPEDADELTDEEGNVIGYWKDGMTYDTTVKEITLKATEKDGTLEITKSN